jgi:hypothetical protein
VLDISRELNPKTPNRSRIVGGSLWGAPPKRKNRERGLRPRGESEYCTSHTMHSTNTEHSTSESPMQHSTSESPMQHVIHHRGIGVSTLALYRHPAADTSRPDPRARVADIPIEVDLTWALRRLTGSPNVVAPDEWPSPVYAAQRSNTAATSAA